MPKKKIHKVPITKDVFKAIVKECGSSIIKLGKCEEVQCTERTIRRSLNEGAITPRLLEQIAKKLDVAPRLLSGEMHKKAESIDNEMIREVVCAQLRADRHPYYEGRKEELNRMPMEELLEQILSLFNIAFSQFEDMDFESQYRFQHDLFDVIIPVVRKHFAEDAYGKEDMPNLEKVLFDLEDFRDEYYINRYVEEVLRKNLLENLPNGKTRSEILSMDAEALMELDACCRGRL